MLIRFIQILLRAIMNGVILVSLVCHEKIGERPVVLVAGGLLLWLVH